ncbi:MAG: F0F1 ATP synthase subunit alpha [Candidatus Omnitrophica bacterium]|nr:F0F1 ATP synthase subunit alpha [Candidatus Omnitrophota bacterium]
MAASLKPKIEIREVGIVKEIRESIARVEGLPSVVNGQIVNFGHDGRGMVMGFTQKEVLVLMFGGKERIKGGDECWSRGEPFLLPVGKGYIGRVVNPLCEPCDGKPPVVPDEYYPAFKVAPGVMERKPVSSPLDTGVKILDAIIPVAKGQRQLIIGDRMTGKTTIAIDTIINQKGKDVICIYCSVGRSYSSLLKAVQIFKEFDALPYTVIVAGSASTPVGEQFLAPYTACTLGEYFMSLGKHVFVVFDDLTKHSWVYRQLSLLLNRPPGREAYPGDIFYIHSQLVERAGQMSDENGGGSMTFFPICDTLQGDITGYIQTNLISMTDGQTVISSALFNQGIKPAIDFGLSVSRIGSKAQCPAMKELSGKLRLEYLQYKELVRMTQLKTSLSQEAAARLRRGEVMTELLKQNRQEPSPIDEQVLHLYALKLGLLDSLSSQGLKRFKKEIHAYAWKELPETMTEFTKHWTLTAPIKKDLEMGFQNYFKAQKGSEE